VVVAVNVVSVDVVSVDVVSVDVVSVVQAFPAVPVLPGDDPGR